MFKKLELNFEEEKKAKEDEIKKKNMIERKTKLKPILKDEIEEFGTKVDKIVEYLTRKRQEQRMESVKVDFDPNLLKTQTYEATVEDDRQQQALELQKQQIKA